MKKLPFKLIQETKLEKWRAETFWSKEPETLAWIEEFEAVIDNNRHPVFYDIGANVGIYSLYAASVHPNLLIFAFEPQLENHIALCRNILLNEFDNIISIYGGGDVYTTIAGFHALKKISGASGGYCSHGAREGQKAIPVYRLDHFAKMFPCPSYVKIDTDGHEIEILKGMDKLISNKIIESMLIEFDLKSLDILKKVFGDLRGCGYSMINKYNNMACHSKTRRKAEGTNVENIVFTKEKANGRGA